MTSPDPVVDQLVTRLRALGFGAPPPDASVTLAHLAQEVRDQLGGDISDATLVAKLTDGTVKAALDATYAPVGTVPQAYRDYVAANAGSGVGGAPISGGSVVLFGTSLEYQNGGGADEIDPATADRSLTGRGWFHWCNAFLANRLRLVRNAGISGNTYAQMLARMDADVLAYPSDWVFMGGPQNDTAGGRSYDAVIADATAILDKLAGRKVLMLTGPPSTAHEGTEIDVLFKVNAWIRRLPQTRKNIVVADIWNALAAPNSSAPTAGLTLDGIHYNLNGASRVGRVAADAVRQWLPNAPHIVSNGADPTSVIANPTFDNNGAGWTVLGTGVAAAYELDDTSYVNRAKLTFTGVTSTGNLGVQYEENISGGRFAPGDKVRCSARIRWENVTPLAVAARFAPVAMMQYVQTDNVVAGPIQDKIWGFLASNEFAIPKGVPTSGDVVISTPIFTIPNTTSPINRIRVRFGFAGISDGVVKVSDVSVVKVV